MNEAQGSNQGSTAVMDRKPEASAAPKKRRLFQRNGKPAAKASVQPRPATLADLANTVPFVPEPRQPDQETGAITQAPVENASSEKPEAKKQIDITVAGMEGQKGQDLLRATAAMDAHEKMQHLASGGKQYESTWDAVKGTAKEMAQHPVKFAAKVWQVGIVDKAVRAELERSGMQQMLTLGTDAALPTELKAKIQEVAQADVKKQHDEKGVLGKVAERGSKAMQIIRAERSALVKAEQQVAEKMRRVVAMPADVLNKAENAELKAFSQANKELIDGYTHVLSGQAAARKAMLEQLAVTRELDDATDAGKKLEGKAKDDFVKNVLMPTVTDALLKDGKLEGPDAELAIQHRLMDFGENLSYATDLRQKAKEIAKAILKTEDHVKGAAAVKAVESFFTDVDVNVILSTVKVEEMAEVPVQRSRVTEKAMRRLKESGGAAEVFAEGAEAAMARWEALNASRAEVWSAVGGALVGYAAFRGASAAGRALGAWVGGTAVVAARVAHRVGASHDRSVSAARTAAARGETVSKNMQEIVVAPMRGMEGTTKQLKDSLNNVQQGALSENQTESVLAQIAAVDARNKAGDSAGFSLWSADKGANYAVAKRDMEKTRLELLKGLRDTSSLAELKSIAARLGVDVSDASSKNAHIDAIRSQLGNALQDNITTGIALGEKVAAAFVDIDTGAASVAESKSKELKSKVKTQAKAAGITAAFGTAFAAEAFAVSDLVSPTPAMAAEASSSTPDIGGSNAPQMEHVAQTAPLDADPGDAGKSVGKMLTNAGKEASGGGNADVFGKDGVWTKNALPIDEREWHNNTGQGFHTLKGKNGELVLQHKGLEGKKNLSFTFDQPKGEKVEPLTIKANDVDHGALRLDPTSDEPVTVVTKDGEVKMSQKEVFTMMVDEKEFKKIKEGTDFASEMNTEHRDVFKLGGEDGKGKGTIEVTVLKQETVKGETKTHADVYATIRGTGKTPESVDMSSAGASTAEAPAVNVPMEPSKLDFDGDGTPDLQVDYPGAVTFDKDTGAIVNEKGQPVITKDQMDAFQQLQTKLGTDVTYGLRYDRASESFDLVDQSTNLTIADNLRFTKDAAGTFVQFDSAYITLDTKNLEKLLVAEPKASETLQLPPQTEVPPQALIDNHAAAFKDVEWVRKGEKDFHTLMVDKDTLRLQQDGKAGYIAIRVGDKTMLAEATPGKTATGQDMGYVDVPVHGTANPDVKVKFYNYADPANPTIMKQTEFADLMIAEKRLDSYLEEMKKQGHIDAEGKGNIATQVHGGTKIFALEDRKDGLGSYIGGANVVKGEDGKPELQLLSAIDANGKMPDTITSKETIPTNFEKTAGGFTLNGQQYEYTGDASKLDIDKKTGNLVDISDPAAPKEILTIDQMAVLGRLPANDKMIMRYDGDQWDMVGKNGVTYVENISVTGNDISFTPTPLADVKFEDGKLVVTTKKPAEVTIPLPTATPPPGGNVPLPTEEPIPGVTTTPPVETTPPSSGGKVSPSGSPSVAPSVSASASSSQSASPAAVTPSPSESRSATISSAPSSAAPASEVASPSSSESSSAAELPLEGESDALTKVLNVGAGLSVVTLLGFTALTLRSVAAERRRRRESRESQEASTPSSTSATLPSTRPGSGPSGAPGAFPSAPTPPPTGTVYGSSAASSTEDPTLRSAAPWSVRSPSSPRPGSSAPEASGAFSPDTASVRSSTPGGDIAEAAASAGVPGEQEPKSRGRWGRFIPPFLRRTAPSGSDAEPAPREASYLSKVPRGFDDPARRELDDDFFEFERDDDRWPSTGNVIDGSFSEANAMEEASAQFGADNPLTSDVFINDARFDLPAARLTELTRQVDAVEAASDPAVFRQGLGMLSKMDDWYAQAGNFIGYASPTATPSDSPLKAFVSDQLDEVIAYVDQGSRTQLERVAASSKELLRNIIVNYAVERLGYDAGTFDVTNLTEPQQNRFQQLISTAAVTPAYFALDAAPARDASASPSEQRPREEDSGTNQAVPLADSTSGAVPDDVGSAVETDNSVVEVQATDAIGQKLKKFESMIAAAARENTGWGSSATRGNRFGHEIDKYSGTKSLDELGSNLRNLANVIASKLDEDPEAQAQAVADLADAFTANRAEKGKAARPNEIVFGGESQVVSIDLKTAQVTIEGRDPMPLEEFLAVLHADRERRYASPAPEGSDAADSTVPLAGDIPVPAGVGEEDVTHSRPELHVGVVEAPAGQRSEYAFVTAKSDYTKLKGQNISRYDFIVAGFVGGAEGKVISTNIPEIITKLSEQGGIPPMHYTHRILTGQGSGVEGGEASNSVGAVSMVLRDREGSTTLYMQSDTKHRIVLDRAGEAFDMSGLDSVAMQGFKPKDDEFYVEPGADSPTKQLPATLGSEDSILRKKELDPADRRVIIGSKRLWDFIPPADALALIRDEADPVRAAELLAAEAYKRGAGRDISVAITNLTPEWTSPQAGDTSAGASESPSSTGPVVPDGAASSGSKPQFSAAPVVEPPPNAPAEGRVTSGEDGTFGFDVDD